MKDLWLATENAEHIGFVTIRFRFAFSRCSVSSVANKFLICLQDGKSIVDLNSFRGVAQLARALRSGRRGRRFKSGHPDHSFSF